jgi:hypothetical protein
MAKVTLEQARAAKSRAMDVFSRAGRVVGVGITKVGGGYAVKVNLSEPLPQGADAPTVIDGVPISVEVVGTIRSRAR